MPAKKCSANIVGNEIIIRVPLEDPVRPTSTGKGMIIATSKGFAKAGKIQSAEKGAGEVDLYVSATAYYRLREPVVGWKQIQEERKRLEQEEEAREEHEANVEAIDSLRKESKKEAKKLFLKKPSVKS